MEQLLLNKTERRKIYWWIYLSTLRLSAFNRNRRCLGRTALCKRGYLRRKQCTGQAGNDQCRPKPLYDRFLHNGIILLFNQKKQRTAF